MTAEQLRPRIAAVLSGLSRQDSELLRDVVRCPPPERGQEGLGGHILGQIGPEPRVSVAENLVRVPLEDRREAVWLAERPLNQVGVTQRVRERICHHGRRLFMAAMPFSWCPYSYSPEVTSGVPLWPAAPTRTRVRPGSR